MAASTLAVYKKVIGIIVAITLLFMISAYYHVSDKSLRGLIERTVLIEYEESGGINQTESEYYTRVYTEYQDEDRQHSVTGTPDFDDEINTPKLSTNATVQIATEQAFPGQPLTPAIKSYMSSQCKLLTTDHMVYRFPSTAAHHPPACPCFNSNMVGRIEPVKEASQSVPLNVSASQFPSVTSGGSWAPHSCYSRQHVAVVIPYRNRVPQLQLLIPRLHTVLQAQNLNYTIFVCEQRYPNDKNFTENFNKAMLMNICFLYASAQSDYDCFVFHDVDFLPEDDRSLYTCRRKPLHLGAWHNTHHYKMPFPMFGAVTVFRPYNFKKLNGFSNRYFGWGGEDDDMLKRARKVIRNSKDISRYVAITHKQASGKGRRRKSRKHHRQVMYNLRHRHPSTDGLNSIEGLYSLVATHQYPLYTHVLADVYKETKETATTKHKPTNTPQQAVT